MENNNDNMLDSLIFVSNLTKLANGEKIEDLNKRSIEDIVEILRANYHTKDKMFQDLLDEIIKIHQDELQGKNLK